MTEEQKELMLERIADAQYNRMPGQGLIQTVTDIPNTSPNGTIE